MTTDMSPSLLTPLTCRWNTPDGRCGKQARPYPEGARCGPHSPWGRAGWPGPTRPVDAPVTHLVTRDSPVTAGVTAGVTVTKT